MVTPTFAAGLGVVVAAGLAVSMTTRTVLHFTGPDQQKYCTARGCATPGPHGGVGTLASAKPGIRLVPATGGPSSGSVGTPSSPAGGQGGGHAAGGQVVIDYQTTQKWSWGFDGQITISGIPDASLNTWRLAFDYPGTSIVEVQGARWEPTGPDSGVAEGGTGSPGGSLPPSGAASQSAPSTSGANQGGAQPTQPDHSSGHNSVVITIEASGPPGAPANCHFDNASCSFR